MSEQEKVDLAAIQAQLELDHATLADRVLSRLGSSSSSSASSSPSSLPTARRPANLGLGAPLPAGTGAASSLKVADARLKGRLIKKVKRSAQDDLLPARAEEEDDDGDEDSRAAALFAKSKGKGKALLKAKSAKSSDPFSAPPPKKQKQAQPIKVQHVPAAVVAADSRETAAAKQPHLHTNGVNGSTSLDNDSEKLSKAQRKKLAKMKRKAEEAAGQIGVATSTGENLNGIGEHASKRAKTAHESKVESPDESMASLAPNTSPLAATSATTPQKSSLTAHQTTLSLSLAGAHFRTLNESLYTTPSYAALSMVRAEPALLESYHAGFRAQVRKWPQRPVDVVASILRGAAEDVPETKGKNKDLGGSGKKKKKTHPLSKTIRLSKAPVVADLGCGEAPLARLFEKDAAAATPQSSFHPRVLSYDLLTSPDGWVQGCDVAARGGVPLPGRLQHAGPRASLVRATQAKGTTNGAKGVEREDTGGAVVEAVVFCLSLMGTNWVEMILEARRILVQGGALVIAEVSSRFTSHDDFVEIITQLGFSHGDIDSSNTHFVVMTFTKQGLPELIEADKELEEWREDGAKLEEAAQLDKAEEKEAVERGHSVLKPCLYKRR